MGSLDNQQTTRDRMLMKLCAGLWVAIPLAIMVDSYAQIMKAFKVSGSTSMLKSKKTK